MIRYRTLEKASRAEYTVERSRFIASASPADSREEAEAFIASVRAEFRDATHNVPAFVVGDKMQQQWASDDGEPAGTAGAPVLQLMVKGGLTNAVIVVTRYFGGIKLGTGGLVRAYSAAARLALEQAGEKDVRDVVLLKVRLAYTLLGRLQNLEKSRPFAVEDIQYADAVTADISFEPEDEEQISGMLTDLCSGEPDIVERSVTVR